MATASPTCGHCGIYDQKRPVAHLEAWRQVAAIAAAFTLPLTTSGQAIAVSIFRGAGAADRGTMRGWRPCSVTARGADSLAVVSFAAGRACCGPIQPFGLAIKWVGPYAKLLLIPLALATALTPRQALHIGYGFLAACVILLALSWASFLWPTGPWGWFKKSRRSGQGQCRAKRLFCSCARSDSRPAQSESGVRANGGVRPP